MRYRGEQKDISSRLGQSAQWGLIGVLMLLSVVGSKWETLGTSITIVEALTLDQSFTPPVNAGADINECCRFIAQTFTAGQTGTLGGITIDVFSPRDSIFPLHAAIRTVVNGVPSTTVLGETTLSSNSSSLSHLITFPQVVNIVEGVQYAIVVNYEGAPPPGPDQFQGIWGAASGDQYPHGELYASFLDGISWFVEPCCDARFQTYVNLAIQEDTTPPVITVAANLTTLWPPNGKLVSVMVSGMITDESGGSGVNVSSAAYVVMDEYGRIQPRGSLTLEVDGSYAFTVALEASRRGNDQDGRHYTIAVSAKDNAGNLGVKSTIITVPHDRGN
jgi:hypothetical protein